VEVRQAAGADRARSLEVSSTTRPALDDQKPTIKKNLEPDGRAGADFGLADDLLKGLIVSVDLAERRLVCHFRNIGTYERSFQERPSKLRPWIQNAEGLAAGVRSEEFSGKR
jgi:hypothetical protein